MPDPNVIRAHATVLESVVTELLALNQAEPNSIPGDLIDALRQVAVEVKGLAAMIGRTAPQTARDARA